MQLKVLLVIVVNLRRTASLQSCMSQHLASTLPERVCLFRKNQTGIAWHAGHEQHMHIGSNPPAHIICLGVDMVYGRPQRLHVAPYD